LGNFPRCLTRRTSLALADDAALARPVIAATQRRGLSTASSFPIFSVRQIVDLVDAGLATAHSQRVVAGGSGRTMEVARMRITEMGRKLAERG